MKTHLQDKRWLISVFILLAAFEFLYRGPIRTLRVFDITDFNTSYVAARLWVKGANSYDASKFMEEWVASGGHRFADRGSPTNTRPAYPPPTLPVLLPLAVLPWIIAKWALLALSVSLFPLMIWSVLRLNNIPWTSLSGFAFSAYSLALAPWHTALAVLSLSGVAIELAIVGAALESDHSAGLLTGLSLCLKPQMGFWFVLFQLVSKQWKRAAWASSLFFGFLLVAVLRLPYGWLESYRENLHYFQALGGVNDFTTANPIRFDLLNLQVILYSLSHKYVLADILSWTITAIFLLLWWRRRAGLAALVLIGLLPFYQRTYNAGVIVLAIGWGFTRMREWAGKLVLLASTVFLIPGAAVLQTLHGKGWISEAVWKQSFLLNVLIAPHGTWAILLVIVVLLVWTVRQPQRASGHLDQLRSVPLPELSAPTCGDARGVVSATILQT